MTPVKPFQLGLLPSHMPHDQLLAQLRPYRDIPVQVAREISQEIGQDEARLRKHAYGLLIEATRHADPSQEQTFLEVARWVIADGLRKLSWEAVPQPTVNVKPTRGRKKSEILVRDVELNLARAWLEHKDQKARQRLLLAYRPLCIKMAQEVARTTSMVIEDLSQEAFLALADSLDKFDPERGYGFGTFARWHVMGQLRRHVMDMQGPVRIGTNLADKKVFLQFRRFRAEWEATQQRALDDQGRREIAARIGVPLETVQRMEPRLGASDVSLDEPLSGDEGEGAATRGSLLVDRGPTPELGTINSVDGARMRKLLVALIEKLPERERSVLSGRLLSERKTEFQELGLQMGVTKERVRQIEQKALKMIREQLEARGLNRHDLIAAG